MPFPPTTSSSRAITFKGFLTTLTLPREEVVMIRGSIHRAQPSFHLFFLYRVPFPLPSFLSRFQACPGFGMFGTTHGRLDPSLRSPTSPFPHRAVAGTSVPAHFPLSCRGCLLLGGRIDVDLRKCGLYHVHITWCMRGMVRNNVKDPPKLKPGQGVFGHSPLRGGRAIRDLVGVSVGLSILPKSVLGIVRNYVSF
ncbi:hypothetical protein CRG98_047110 [Punica granatum]|uniref:Uncharacterized protein n=1 Tax=Punica granatum TaxID=22663 RepID=A0A2I0HLA3_PUNGR|nr:hypothetical protein CRG98_047110 [Punica granatum]